MSCAIFRPFHALRLRPLFAADTSREKRQRTAAVQDLSDSVRLEVRAKRFGVRQSSAAFAWHQVTQLLLLWLLFCAPRLLADDISWPQFRGPRGDGTSVSTGLPLRWSEGKEGGTKWKIPIHGRAWSSPVIWGDQVWVTTATENGRELFVVCVDRDSGKIVHDLKLFEVENPQAIHQFNTYASPTPVIEEGRLYATFGSPGTACLDTQTGKVLWSRRDLECNHYRGPGSSPILHRDLFILNFDGSDHQFIVALDKKTGRTVWRKERSVDFKDLDGNGQPKANGDFRKAFATCQVATFDGLTTLLSQGSKALYAYDPLTGEELWHVEERAGYSGCGRPVIGYGMVFVTTGHGAGQLLAIRPGRKGEVLDADLESGPSGADKPETTGAPTKSDATTPTGVAAPGDGRAPLKVVWRAKRSVPKKPSLVLAGELLFGIDDNGVATCWEARSGSTLWNERIGGNYSASPLAAEGRIYFFSEEGKTTIVAAKGEFEKLAENQLDDGFMASPAVSGKGLFLRTRTSLYCIEETPKSQAPISN
jgi:outer membrane protein assembly factor BamB